MRIDCCTRISTTNIVRKKEEMCEIHRYLKNQDVKDRKEKDYK